jgi:glycosyltransferase involved in cell wall biosynthesis
MNPKVSLIMTVYNRERYLEEAITSVLAQIYDNYELILWDDGSTDRSGKIAAHYATKDRRIRFSKQNTKVVTLHLELLIKKRMDTIWAG